MPLPPGDGSQELQDEFHEETLDLGLDFPSDPQAKESPEPQTDEEGFAPFDLAQARPSIFDPVPEEEVGPLLDEEGNRLPEFDPRYRDDFHGLAFIGSLSREFEWLGHKFVIRTLTVDELLAVTLLTKEYDQTMGAGLAYRTAMVALATQKVDGSDLPVPVAADSNDFAWAYQRFNYVKARWFQFTIEAVYLKYLELEMKTTSVVEAMGKASAPAESTTG
jgi:hypothetical protein